MRSTAARERRQARGRNVGAAAGYERRTTMTGQGREGRDDQEAAEDEGWPAIGKSKRPIWSRCCHLKEQKAYEPTSQNSLGSSPKRLIVIIFLSA